MPPFATVSGFVSVRALNVGLAPECMSCGVESTMLPADGKATFTWFVVPFSVLYSFALPSAFIPRSWLEDPRTPDANAFHVKLETS